MNPARRRLAFLVARWAAGLGLLGFLLTRVAWRPLAAVMRDISPGWLAVLLAFSFVLIWISCVKWKMLLGEKGKDVGVPTLMSLYMVGYFFSQFLPSQYGGDLVRSYELGRDIKCQVSSLGSVFLERYTGFAALVLVAGAAALFVPDLLRRPEVGVPFLAAWAIFALSLWLVADPRPARWLARRLAGGPLARAGAAAESLHLQVRRALGDRPLLLRVMALSALFHLLAVVNTWLGIRTVGATVPLLPLVVVVPLILMVSSVPITVNGVGIWEGAFVVLLVPLGLSDAQALSVALILRAKGLLQGLLGGIVYLARSRGRR